MRDAVNDDCEFNFFGLTGVSYKVVIAKANLHAYAFRRARHLMTRIFVLFNLKSGVDRAAFENWARTTDLPIVRQLSSIAAFDVFEVTGLFGSDAKPPYEYVEVVDVADMHLFGEEVASQTMQRVAGEFTTFAEPVFLLSRALPV
jgi:hypothetical protein